MKNTPKYARSQKKTHTLLDQFYMNLIPYSCYARTALNWKNTLLREFLDKPDTPLDIRVAPGIIYGLIIPITNTAVVALWMEHIL